MEGVPTEIQGRATLKVNSYLDMFVKQSEVKRSKVI